MLLRACLSFDTLRQRHRIKILDLPLGSVAYPAPPEGTKPSLTGAVHSEHLRAAIRRLRSHTTGKGSSLRVSGNVNRDDGGHEEDRSSSNF